MKIIQHFSDYYDGVAVDGDPKHVWDRKLSDHYNRFMDHSGAYNADHDMVWGVHGNSWYDVIGHDRHNLKRLHMSAPGWAFQLFVFVIAGRIYPRIRYEKRIYSQTRLSWLDEYVWLDDVESYCEAAEEWIEKVKKSQGGYYSFNPETARKSWQAVLDLDADKIHKFYNSPVVALKVSGNHYTVYGNACLKEYEFQKVLDPYTARYELEMYFCNHLAPAEKMIEIDNDSKIKAAGFDLKDSFRTQAPGGPRRKRKKK